MYLMLQQDKPDYYVLVSGVTTTVRNFIKKAFLDFGVVINFEDENEK